MSRLAIRLYGGVNEIGGNKFLLEDGDHRLLLDFGASLGARGSYFEEFLQPRTNSILRDLLRLGLLPDVDGVYRDDFLTVARSATDKDLPESATAWRAREGKPAVDGVLLTHAHVDHFQDLSFLDPDIPVYATRTTLAMLRAITRVTGPDVDKEILTARVRSVGELGGGAAFPGERTVNTRNVDRTFVCVDEGVPFRVGAFEVLPVPVDHSVPGACAFIVKCPGGKRVFYSGDVRFHGRLMDRTSALLKAADGLEPDVMLCEGTRMDSDAADGEADVEDAVRRLVADARGLVAAEFAWKDTTRFDTLQRIAESTGRTLLVDARLAYLLHALDADDRVPSRAIEGYDNVRVYVRRRGSMLDEASDFMHHKHELGYHPGFSAKDVKGARDNGDEAFLANVLKHHRDGVRAADVRAHPERFIVHLSFWSINELFDLDPPPGSRWIRCLTEPFSDEMALDLKRQRNWLEHFGLDHNVRVAKGEDDGLLAGTTHVSGHGARPDLEKLVKSAKPACLVPVHTREDCLDRFEDLRMNAHVFRGATHRHAARGEIVVEP